MRISETRILVKFLSDDISRTELVANRMIITIKSLQLVRSTFPHAIFKTRLRDEFQQPLLEDTLNSHWSLTKHSNKLEIYCSFNVNIPSNNLFSLTFLVKIFLTPKSKISNESENSNRNWTPKHLTKFIPLRTTPI